MSRQARIVKFCMAGLYFINLPRQKMKYRCPKCNKPVLRTAKSDKAAPASGRYFPFCSERCKLLDIGAWLDGDYRIPVSNRDDPEDI